MYSFGEDRKTKRAASYENRPDERRSGTTRNRTGDKDFQSFALPTELWHHHVFTTHTLAIIVAISELRCKGSAFI